MDLSGRARRLQVTAQPQRHALTSAADDLKTSPAWLAAQTTRDEWPERLPADRSAWLGWMLELPQPDLLELVAFCASTTVNALPSIGKAAEANELARAIDLDMGTDWWKPTLEGFLNHVSKAQIAEALRETGRDLARDGVERMKKTCGHRCVRVTARMGRIGDSTAATCGHRWTDGDHAGGALRDRGRAPRVVADSPLLLHHLALGATWPYL
jgi:hypothetical protein